MLKKLSVTMAIPVIISGLAACSGGSENSSSYEMAEEAATEAANTAADAVDADTAAPQRAARSKEGGKGIGADGAKEIPVSIPQIAYSYRYGYRLAAGEISKVQQAHANLCEKKGPDICRVINMERSGGEADYASAMLHLEVAAPKARGFGAELAKAAEEQGGEEISTSIKGEDLSKQIVDTEARLRSRELLASRLTDLLRTRKGSVAELVEAERALTNVNEEIDQARSWLKEMRGRVAFSKMVINYESGSPLSGGFFRPIREAFNGVASTMGFTIGAMITLVAFLLPWALLIWLIVYLRRRFKAQDRTFFGRKIEEEPAGEQEATGA